MERYGNRHGDSGVLAFEIVEDGIAIWFRSGEGYLYTEASAGRQNLEHMKTLAREGRGLSSFIARTVRGRYAARLPAKAYP